MDYNILKKLKDNGFPLRECLNSQLAFVFGMIQVDGTPYLIPTISEMIEEIRKDNQPFGGITLIVEQDGSSQVTSPRMSVAEGFIKGDTPIEALSKLWLKLKAR